MSRKERKHKQHRTNGYEFPTKKLNPIARVILMAVYDDNNVWNILVGMRYIVKHIYELSIDHNAFKSYVDTNGIYCQYMTNITFPLPFNININMMPFIMSNSWEQTKLPESVKPYWRIIKACLGADGRWLTRGKIGFLTIQESFVEKGKTQRRPGLHCECPGKLRMGSGKAKECWHKYDFTWGRGVARYFDSGGYEFQVDGGIYMASSVSNSCVAWDCKIVKDKNGRDVIGHLGDIEHLRDNLDLGKRRWMKAKALYWITDRTPHEVLPMMKSGYRQYFRLVTDDVSIWYEEHSTLNPNGVMPDPKITKIIKGNKFDYQFDGLCDCGIFDNDGFFRMLWGVCFVVFAIIAIHWYDL